MSGTRELQRKLERANQRLHESEQRHRERLSEDQRIRMVLDADSELRDLVREVAWLMELAHPLKGRDLDRHRGDGWNPNPPHVATERYREALSQVRELTTQLAEAVADVNNGDRTKLWGLFLPPPGNPAKPVRAWLDDFLAAGEVEAATVHQAADELGYKRKLVQQASKLRPEVAKWQEDRRWWWAAPGHCFTHSNPIHSRLDGIGSCKAGINLGEPCEEVPS